MSNTTIIVGSHFQYFRETSKSHIFGLIFGQSMDRFHFFPNCNWPVIEALSKVRVKTVFLALVKSVDLTPKGSSINEVKQILDIAY